MGINMIEQKNGEQIFEYKFPGFINEANFLGDSSDDYEILQVLGKGGFSKVLKVKSKSTYGIYAMKKVNMEKIMEEQKTQKYFENEVIILQRLNNPNVCKCYNIFQDNNYLYFIMEFMNNGDLKSFYAANKLLKNQVPEEKLWDIFYKCLNGLVYIHQQGLIHRDIKLENLFLDDELNIKIGDFNVSVAVDENAAKKFSQEPNKISNMLCESTKVGTNGYMAPEIQRNFGLYGQNVDVYSMGIAFFELCYWCNPYDYNVIKEKYYNKNIYSKELNDLIDKMIEKNASNRFSSYQAFSIAKKYFIQKYVKNSSVDAVLNCFYNFPNFNEFYCCEKYKFFLTNYKKEVSKGVYDVIQSLKGNNKDIIDNALYELRKNMIKAGLDIKKDNEEIDPAILISFLINKLNSDLNEIEFSNNNINSGNRNQFMVLSSSFKFSQFQAENIFNFFINSYNNRINSLISRNFFSVIITKKECMNKGCVNSGCYFSMFYFIHFNVDILSKKCENLTLKNAFNTFTNDRIILKEDKNIYCENCRMVTQHRESKKFYVTGKNLIIVFDRGENSKNTQFIDFNEQLILNTMEVEKYKEVRYQLIGIIEKIENENNQEEYISFIKKENNLWVSNKDKGKVINFEDIKKMGIVISLFYYCQDKNMILNSQNNFISNNIYNPQFHNNQMNFNNNNMNNDMIMRMNSDPQNNNMNALNFKNDGTMTNTNKNNMINSMPNLNLNQGINNININNNGNNGMFMNVMNNNFIVNNGQGFVNNGEYMGMGNVNNKWTNMENL